MDIWIYPSAIRISDWQKALHISDHTCGGGNLYTVGKEFISSIYSDQLENQGNYSQLIESQI